MGCSGSLATLHTSTPGPSTGSTYHKDKEGLKVCQNVLSVNTQADSKPLRIFQVLQELQEYKYRSNSLSTGEDRREKIPVVRAGVYNMILLLNLISILCSVSLMISNQVVAFNHNVHAPIFETASVPQVIPHDAFM